MRWDGSTWAEVGELQHGINALLVLADGTVFAGGAGLYRWRGDGWVTILNASP